MSGWTALMPDDVIRRLIKGGLLEAEILEHFDSTGMAITRDSDGGLSRAQGTSVPSTSVGLCRREFVCSSRNLGS